MHGTPYALRASRHLGVESIAGRGIVSLSGKHSFVGEIGVFGVAPPDQPAGHELAMAKRPQSGGHRIGPVTAVAVYTSLTTPRTAGNCHILATASPVRLRGGWGGGEINDYTLS